MKYRLSPSLENHYLKIEADFIAPCHKPLIYLPAWRPGRYQIQNFAKNVKKLELEVNGMKSKPKKQSKDAWQLECNKGDQVRVTYFYYAFQKDAGGSFFDEQFFYINPINCCIYLEEYLEASCEISLKFENNKCVAWGLPYKKSGNEVTAQATSFHQLVDAPVMLSNTMQHRSYKVDHYTFHIWIQGRLEVEWDQLLFDFASFTRTQCEVFGVFPEPEYHFMLWSPPHAYYHGVEHYNSTMMVLGPDTQPIGEMYTDLLGLSSHELFHTWNVKRIRPVELLPYRYNEENYFETCFVAEGLTTFYGDWMLYRSGVFDREAYHKELESTLKRHFDFADESDLSLLESSYDLWLDGYEKGAPERKVSVYHKGAIAALILNSELKPIINHPFPLDLIMQRLWEQYGEPFLGFTYENYVTIVNQLSQRSLENYFSEVIEGNKSIYMRCQKALESMDFQMAYNSNGKLYLKDLKKQAK